MEHTVGVPAFAETATCRQERSAWPHIGLRILPIIEGLKGSDSSLLHLLNHALQGVALAENFKWALAQIQQYTGLKPIYYYPISIHDLKDVVIQVP